MKLRLGTITQVENNSTKMQTVQVTGGAGETSGSVDVYSPYGLTSFSMPIDPNTGQGAECVLADIFGTGHTSVLSLTDRRYRPTVGHQGDVMLFSNHDTPSANHDEATQRIVFTDDGTRNYRLVVKLNKCKVELKSDNTITITNDHGTFVIAANGDTTLTAPNFTVNANTAFTGTLTSNGKNISSTHSHGGTQPGSGSTGVPN